MTLEKQIHWENIELVEVVSVRKYEVVEDLVSSYNEVLDKHIFYMYTWKMTYHMFKESGLKGMV